MGGWMPVQSLTPVAGKCKCKPHYIDMETPGKESFGIPKPMLLAAPCADISIKSLWVWPAGESIPATLPNDQEVEILDTYGYEECWDYIKIRDNVNRVEGWVPFEHMPALTEPFRSLSY